MKETRSIYNTEPLLNEVELVIKNGLNKILAKTLQRYELLERTHKQLMKLPSIVEELDKDDDSDSDSDSDYDNKLNLLKKCSQKPVTHWVNKDDLCNVERKIDNIEKKYLNLYGLMDKLIDKIEVLNNKVDKMTFQPKPIENISIKPSIESSIVSACQNENITVDIDFESASDNESVEEEAESVIEIKNEKEIVHITIPTVKVEESAIEVLEAEEEEEEEVEEDEAEAEEEDGIEEDKVVEENNDENSVETETKEEQDEEEEVETETKDEQEEEEEELFEIDIDDITYCTNDENNGSIYELKDGDVGDKVGYFKEGEPFFYADEN